MYKPGRLAKLAEVKLQHSQVLGRRYDYHRKTRELPGKVQQDKEILIRYAASHLSTLALVFFLQQNSVEQNPLEEKRGYISLRYNET